MNLAFRPALALLVICGLLTAGALLVGYRSPTVISILASSIEAETYVLEVWDMGRHFRFRLAGTRCYHDEMVAEIHPQGGSVDYLQNQIENGIDAVVLLKC